MPPKKSKHKKSHRPSRKSHSSRPPRVGPAFDKLVAVMNRLRSPGGCPWDREQTHATLRTYLIEEAYEVLDALDSTDDAKFAEELGDLLLQVLFHAQIAREESRFSIADVIREIYEKMIRRHPHVFGTKRAKTAVDVLRNWEIIKQQERRQREAKEEKAAHVAAGLQTGTGESASPNLPEPVSILDGVPRTLPALLEALQLNRKAARIGFDWHNLEGIFAKLDEETHELRHALVAQGEQSRRSRSEGGSASPAALQPSTKLAPPASTPHSAVESELGDLLFVAVNLARFLDIDPEIALKKSNAKFSRRFREMERLARAQGTTLAHVPRPQMESLWDQAKLLEFSGPKSSS